MPLDFNPAARNAAVTDPPASTDRPRLTRWPVLVGAAALILAPLGFGRWRTETAAAAARPPLAVDPADADFGTVWASPNHRLTVPVRNLSDEPVEVARAWAECGCTNVAPEAFTIPAGGTVPVTLTLDLHPALPGQADAAERGFATHLNFVTRQWPATQRAVVRGRVRHLWKEPPRLDFDGPDALVQDWPATGRTVELTTHPGVRALRLGGPAERLESKPSAAADDAPHTGFAGAAEEERAAGIAPPTAELAAAGAGRYRLTVRPPPTDRTGRFAFALPLIAETDAGERIAGPAVEVRGAVLPDMEVLPAFPRYPAAAAGRPVEVELHLRSRTGRPFRVLKTRVSETRADAAAVAVGSPDAGTEAAAHALSVRREAAPAGSFADRVEVRTTAGTRTLLIRGLGRTPPARRASLSADRSSRR